MDRAVEPQRSCSTRRNITSSLLLPSFVARLADPSIRRVLLCGCGGGFDFVHSLALYPELRRLGKEIVIGSYSIGDPHKVDGALPVFDEDGAIAARVTAANKANARYGPEVHVCSYLDHIFPDTAPHFVYAYCTRAFTVPALTRLYRHFISVHSIDAIVLVDGGSDSLLVGDEEGLGGPIEDAVSSATGRTIPLATHGHLVGFDVESVARRSLIGQWIRVCLTVPECYDALRGGRRTLGGKRRDVENLPRHEEMRSRRS